MAGYIIDVTGSFALNFLIAGAILAIGILCYLLLLGKIEQIPVPGEETVSLEQPPATTSTSDKRSA
ncbi:MAG TPA: hypothetical protein VK140_13765 [Ktedonobacteraceae bacterium]|nr:hypothetical protein [Ktedonobacteraceae bacterium]